MIESIIEHAAIETNMDPLQLRFINMTKKHEKLLEHIKELKIWADIDKRKLEINKFNMVNLLTFIYEKNYV